VSNLLLLTALCLETTPEVLAEEIRDAGSAALKPLVTEAINERLRPIRRKRHELDGEVDVLRRILADGADRARTSGNQTLEDVRRVMHNAY
jgi:tryptophanyl-tRNA synthetase